MEMGLVTTAPSPQSPQVGAGRSRTYAGFKIQASPTLGGKPCRREQGTDQSRSEKHSKAAVAVKTRCWIGRLGGTTES